MIVACIPAYNEEKTIARVILQAQKHVDTVIVCDDGSSDLTREIASRLGAVVLRHEKNMGYGATLQSLFRKARDMNADVMLTLDADSQHDPIEIPNLIQPILEDKADIVVGSRFLQKNKDIPAYRRFGIKLLTKMSDGSVKNEISDAQCGFRAYNRKALQQLRLSENGMGVSAEAIRKARDQGLRIAEVSVHVSYKGLETSTHNPVRHGLSVLWTIVQLVVEERPLFYLGIPGAILLCVGFGFGIWTLQLYSLTGGIVTNVALAAFAFTVLATFMLFTAITLYAIVRLSEKQKAEQS